MEQQKEKIRKYYDSNPKREWARLDKYGIEFQVTLKHLLKHLKPNSKILDIGGGPGRYAFALTEAGHEVHLTDLSPGHIEFAQQKQKELGIILGSATVRDAEDLSQFPDNTFDAVINLGPLYHIQEDNSRNKTISESIRVLKKNGLCTFGFISIYAPIYDIVKKDPSTILSKYDDLLRFIDTGIRIESEKDPGFTDIYLIDPMKIEDLFVNSPVEKVSLFGTEGLTAQSETRIIQSDLSVFKKWVDLAYLTSTTIAGVNGSEHIVYMARKK
ncbi:MAG: class I SAM-dependent methyltransferase [Spirochaetales bacterium]|nr:class I SAM-dependent methyltransferase [Spirochaetales bacterium]